MFFMFSYQQRDFNGKLHLFHLIVVTLPVYIILIADLFCKQEVILACFGW